MCWIEKAHVIELTGLLRQGPHGDQLHAWPALMRVFGWTAFTGLQVPFNLRRDIERELLPMAETLGMSVAAWSPLADGILAGELGATPAQVAIAWTRARSPVIHPIIGARRLPQLLDNLAAAELELPAEMVRRLDAATEPDLGFPTTFIRDTGPWVFGVAAVS